MLLPTALLVLCGAALSATNDPYAYLLAPQIGYAQSGAPICLAVVGVAGPALVAREASRHGYSALAAVASVEAMVLISCAIAIWWIGRRVSKRVAVRP